MIKSGRGKKFSGPYFRRREWTLGSRQFYTFPIFPHYSEEELNRTLDGIKDIDVAGKDAEEQGSRGGK